MTLWDEHCNAGKFQDQSEPSGNMYQSLNKSNSSFNVHIFLWILVILISLHCNTYNTEIQY